MGFSAAIIGRPNVGKSTLFNRLVGRKLALVDDTPGVTRDRRVHAAKLYDLSFDVIDTAGFEDAGPETLAGRMRRQTEIAIREADVGVLIKAASAAYDAILLDVDNGPEGLTVPANDRLYDHGGLAAARRALKPGGVLGVWSQGPDARFSRRLRDCGFAVEEVKARAGRGRGARHVIWLATNASAKGR